MRLLLLLLLQVKENLPVVEMLRELAASYFKKGSEDRMNRIKGIHIHIYTATFSIRYTHRILLASLLTIAYS
jgi:hypothetical protein